MRELLFYWDRGGLNVLVPKKRGAGFLKVPLGHHNDNFFAELEERLRCDICGLDGYLEFQVGGEVSVYSERRFEFQSRALPPLEENYGCGNREASKDEFFSHLICQQKPQP